MDTRYVYVHLLITCCLIRPNPLQAYPKEIPPLIRAHLSQLSNGCHNVNDHIRVGVGLLQLRNQHLTECGMRVPCHTQRDQYTRVVYIHLQYSLVGGIRALPELLYSDGIVHALVKGNSTHLEDGGMVGVDQFGGIGHEVSKQLDTLFLVPIHSAALQLCQDLNQHLEKCWHDKGRVEVAEVTNDAHGQFSDAKYLERERGGAGWG